MAVYTIGQLAKLVGVPITTLRFYERVGLLAPEARTESNYRSYTDGTAERLRFIRGAQATGFSIKDIGEMLELAHADHEPCAEIATLIEKRLADVRSRIRELRRVERGLGRSLKACCVSEPDWCRAIEQLRSSPNSLVATTSDKSAKRP